MAISFVASAFNEEDNNDTSFVFTNPSGTQEDDLLIGFLALNATGESEITVTPPSGWTLVRSVYQSQPNTFNSQIAVMIKTHDGSEPSSWTGSIGSAVDVKLMAVSAYRGTDPAANQFIAEGESGSNSDENISTATVNNTDDGAWRIIAGSDNAGNAGTATTNEVAERVDENHTNGNDFAGLLVADSNGTISTGNTSRTVDFSNGGADSIVTWIGLIKPLSTATGTASITAPVAQVDIDGEKTIDATSAITAPVAQVETDADVVVDADADVTAPSAQVDITGDVQQNLLAITAPLPSVSMVGEEEVIDATVPVVAPAAQVALPTSATVTVALEVTAPGATFGCGAEVTVANVSPLGMVGPAAVYDSLGHEYAVGPLVLTAPFPSFLASIETRIFGERVKVVETDFNNRVLEIPLDQPPETFFV